MKVLLAPTEDFIKSVRTQLSAGVSAGSSAVVPVSNVAGLAVNDYVVVGLEGSQQAELCQITAISGESITVDLLKLGHLQDDPVVKYRYNKRKFYGSTVQAGPFTELTSYGSPTGIMVDAPQGTTLEYTGGEGYIYFKSTYYNSTDTTESNLADANTVLADESKRYCSIYAIRKQGGLTNNPYLTDGFIETYRKRAENEVNSYLNARYILPLTNSSGVAEIPFMVENMTVLLAAGYMDYQELGSDGEGKKWLGEARAVLKALQTPGGQQLLGSDNAEMQTKTLSNGVISNETESNGDDDCDQPFFDRNQTF